MRAAEVALLIWRRKWHLAVLGLTMAAAVYFRSDSLPETYEAASTVLVEPAGAAPLVAAVTDLPALVGPAARAADVDDPHVKATSLDGPGLLGLRARARSAAGAEAMLSSLTAELRRWLDEHAQSVRAATVARIEPEVADLSARLAASQLPPGQRQALEAQLDELSRQLAAARVEPAPAVSVVAAPAASRAPVAPTPVRDGLLALLLGIVTGAIAVVAIEATSERIPPDRANEDIMRLTGLPVLGTIPRSTGVEAVEAFRALRTNLMFLSTGERLRSLAVVSPDPGTGKTYVALNLARETATLGVSVALVDADLRRPRVHERLGLERGPGLSDALLLGMVDREALPIRHGVRVLPAGTEVADPAGHLGAHPFRGVLAAMDWAELVVVDTPAARLFADAGAVASQCDATLVVVDLRTTQRRHLRELAEHLRQLAALPLGVVVNRSETPDLGGYRTADDRRPPGASRPAAPGAGGEGAAEDAAAPR